MECAIAGKIPGMVRFGGIGGWQGDCSSEDRTRRPG